MALLIPECLLERKDFVTSDVAKGFLDWARTAKDVRMQTRTVVNMAAYRSNSRIASPAPLRSASRISEYLRDRKIGRAHV